MSLAVEHRSSVAASPVTAVGEYRDGEPVLAVSSLDRQCTPVTSGDNTNAVSITPNKRSFSNIISNGTDRESPSPLRKVTKRLLDLDPFTIFDCNSRDSGFESETSRLSYSLSAASASCSPATPSSVSVVSIGCVSGDGQEDAVCTAAQEPVERARPESTPLCLWDNCIDPNLSSEGEDGRPDLLGHLLSHHVQPMELNEDKEDQVGRFKCLWRGCKVYGKGSRLYSWLEGHVIERHAGPRPFACPLPGCQQRFNSKLLAERHINSHFNTDDLANNTKKSTKMAPTISRRRPPSPVVADAPIEATKTRRRPLAKGPAGLHRHVDRKRRDFFLRNDATKCVRTVGRRGVARKNVRELQHETACRVIEPSANGKREVALVVSHQRRQGKRTTATGSPSEICGGVVATGGGVTGTKRKAARCRNVPEDAFDAAYTRAMHVLSARSMISNRKSKRAWSCQKYSGCSRHTDPSSFTQCHHTDTISQHCQCSHFITFHAKVLAKRTCNGKEGSIGVGQCQLFCSWTPAGLLTPKWIDQASFKSTIRLPRGLFPSLASPDASVSHEPKVSNN